MPTNPTNSSIAAISVEIEIPDAAYERAEARYNDLGEWFSRPESSVHNYDPEVFSQGSFLLGTVTRPFGDEAEYDLDLVVKLRHGVSKTSHTQAQLKEMVGEELELYRQARGIQKELEEKRRCWRLQYQDDLSFHLDVVPCIPEDRRRRGIIKEAMMAADTAKVLADEVANLTVSITDTERDDYNITCLNWNVSNPQGYGRWFASCVRQAKQTVLMTEKRAEVEELPTYKLKAPLQRCVQILKLHRDLMFEDDPDRAPISIIITTLAARAYQGQEDVGEALLHIVNTMGEQVKAQTPRVPNPVNPGSAHEPGEDFSDKWETEEGRALGLEENFWRWLEQAKADFSRMAEMRNADDLATLAEKSLGVHLNKRSLRKRLGQSVAASAPTVSNGKSHTTPSRTHIQNPPKPWATK